MQSYDKSGKRVMDGEVRTIKEAMKKVDNRKAELPNLDTKN